MKRTFQLDVERGEQCGGRLKLRALVTLPHNIERRLRHLGDREMGNAKVPAEARTR